jgi:glycosyltransferase involved in cell wall biosynthesis
MAYWFPPDAWSGAERPYRFFKYLRRYRYAANVIASPHPEALPDEAISRVPTGQETSSVRAWSVITKGAERLLPYGQESHWIPAAVARATELLQQGDYSAVVSTSPPNATHLAAWWLRKRHSIKWIADLRDPIYGNPFHQSRYAKGYDRTLEKLVVTSADAVIANTDQAADVLRTRYPTIAEKIKVIWNGYDPDAQIVAQPIPSRDHRLLLHAGSIYGGRQPSALLRAMDRLIRAGVLSAERFRVRLIGWIDRTEGWLETCDFDRLTKEGWVECVDHMLPKQEAHNEMAAADGLLLLDLNKEGTGLQVPAKLFEYILIGRPILALSTRGSPTETILRQSGIRHTLIYQDDSPAVVETKVLRFFEHSTEPQNPSDWFQTMFNGERQTESLARILDAILKR